MNNCSQLPNITVPEGELVSRLVIALPAIDGMREHFGPDRLDEAFRHAKEFLENHWDRTLEAWLNSCSAKVYVIGWKNDGPFKVGVTTKSVKSRISNLQTGNPHPLKAYITVPCTSVEDAYEIESAVLKLCKKINGEWVSADIKWIGTVIEWSIRMQHEEGFAEFFDRLCQSEGANNDKRSETPNAKDS